MRTIYLDYNATTPVAPSVQEAMLPFLTEHYGNPSSSHALGRACHEAIAESRGRMAELLGCEVDEVIFTSGGTESNNTALKGLASRLLPHARGHLVISAVEHPAIVEPAAFLKRLGFDVTVVGCNGQGEVDPDDVRRAIRADTFLVSIMHANNEIGTIQPIRQIATICRDRGVPMHSDAAQSAGKIPVRVDDLGLDLLSIAGHKLYAPKGIGALYVRRGTALEPFMHGAGHEGGMRAGTENTAYIVALGRAATLGHRSLEESSARMTMLRNRLLGHLREAIGEGLSVNGDGAARLPNTLSVNFPGVAGGELLGRVPEICASTGAACHSGATTRSATLKAIGLPAQLAQGTVRLSVGWHTSEEEIDRAASLLIAAWENLQ